MTKLKSKLIKGTVTLKRLWNLFLGGLILDETKSSPYPSSTSVRSDATINGSYQACWAGKKVVVEFLIFLV